MEKAIYLRDWLGGFCPLGSWRGEEPRYDWLFGFSLTSVFSTHIFCFLLRTTSSAFSPAPLHCRGALVRTKDYCDTLVSMRGALFCFGLWQGLQFTGHFLSVNCTRLCTRPLRSRAACRCPFGLYIKRPRYGNSPAQFRSPLFLFDRRHHVCQFLPLLNPVHEIPELSRNTRTVVDGGYSQHRPEAGANQLVRPLDLGADRALSLLDLLRDAFLEWVDQTPT